MTRHWYWVIPILLYALLWSLHEISADTLYRDERQTIRHLGDVVEFHTADEIINSITHSSPQHTPGYFLLLGGWVRLVGYSPMALRYLSVLLGLLGIAWTYRLARDAVSAHAGVLAAALTGTSAFYVFYMHEMRMYSLLVLLIVFMLWLYLRLLNAQRPGRIWEWVGLFGGALALLYTHIFAIFPLLAIGLYHLIRVENSRRWWTLTLTLGAVALAFLPWLTITLGAARIQGSFNLDVLPPVEIPGLITYLFGNGFTLLGVVTLIGILAALVARRSAVGAMGFILLAMFISLVIVNGFVDLMSISRARYVLIFWPVLALLLGVALTELKFSRLLPVGVIIIWLMAGLLFRIAPDFDAYNDRKGVEPLPDFARILHTFYTHPDESDTLAFVVANTNLRRIRDMGDYYFRLVDVPSFILPATSLTDEAESGIEEAVSEQLAAHAIIWQIFRPVDVSPAELNQVEAILTQTHMYCDSLVNDNDLRIERYARLPEGCKATP